MRNSGKPELRCHPRLGRSAKDVDARDKPARDGGEIRAESAPLSNNGTHQESNMKQHPIIAALASIAVSSALLATPADAMRIEQKRFAAKSYPGSRDRDYKVFVPSSYSGQTAVPMVMVLHGCSQTEQNMIAETRFRELAERDGFIVVYPFITSFDGFRAPNCWGFFLEQHIHEGAGEPEDLHQLAREVEAAFKIDPNRRYVTGLSSGAGMAVVLAVAKSEYFAAAGAVAGLPYSETASAVPRSCSFPGTFRQIPAVVDAMRAEQRRPEKQRPVPIMAIHSRNDCTVHARAAENIRDSWIARYGMSPTPTATLDCRHEGVACTHAKYGPPQRSVVETVLYDGERGDGISGTGAHYWVGDNPGQFANPRGPSASELLWAFFKNHPFAEREPPSVAIASTAASGRSVTVAGTASSPGASIVEVGVRLDGRFPQPQIVAAGTTAWTVTFDNLPDNASYLSVATVRDSDGVAASVSGPAVAVGIPPPNAAPEVAVTDVRATGSCIRVAGTATDPEGRLAAVAAELGTRGLKPATINGRDFSYQECGLPAGRYATRAVATDDEGLESTGAGPTVDIAALESATANWQGHMSAGRIRVYGGQCGNFGFGTCDAAFADIFLRHGFNAFALHRRPAASDWYENAANVP
jgi:poly(hydroxyalkanoate) depolymerase family esterase